MANDDGFSIDMDKCNRNDDDESLGESEAAVITTRKAKAGKKSSTNAAPKTKNDKQDANNLATGLKTLLLHAVANGGWAKDLKLEDKKGVDLLNFILASSDVHKDVKRLTKMIVLKENTEQKKIFISRWKDYRCRLRQRKKQELPDDEKVKNQLPHSRGAKLAKTTRCGKHSEDDETEVGDNRTLAGNTESDNENMDDDDGASMLTDDEVVEVHPIQPMKKKAPGKLERDDASLDESDAEVIGTSKNEKQSSKKAARKFKTGADCKHQYADVQALQSENESLLKQRKEWFMVKDALLKEKNELINELIKEKNGLINEKRELNKANSDLRNELINEKAKWLDEKKQFERTIQKLREKSGDSPDGASENILGSSPDAPSEDNSDHRDTNADDKCQSSSQTQASPPRARAGMHQGKKQAQPEQCQSGSQTVTGGE